MAITPLPSPCAVFVRAESPQVNWMRCLARVNEQLSQQGLKRANGNYVSCDATLISSARRPCKQFKGEGIDQDSDEVNTFGYSDDVDAGWKNKGTQSVYGYAGFVSTDEEGFVEAVTSRTVADSEVRHFPEVIDRKGRYDARQNGVV